MKIGIPRALLYHKYNVMWETFFSELGIETIVSGQTTREVFDCGLKYCLDEVCLPVKTFYGHILSLKDKVDAIFIPQVISIEKRKTKFSFTCPKMIGLPDMIRATFPKLNVLSIKIDEQKRPEILSYVFLGLKLSNNIFHIIKAYIRARKAQVISEDESKKNIGKALKSDLRVALLSHSYNLCESYPNVNIERALNSLGVVPLTLEMLPKKEMRKESEKIFPELSWNYERELLGAARHIIKNKMADGVIMLANFGCGPDSLVGDYILRLGRRESDIPFTMIVTDEHTGEAGLMTRLEAFIDMIRLKTKKDIK